RGEFLAGFDEWLIGLSCFRQISSPEPEILLPDAIRLVAVIRFAIGRRCFFIVAFFLPQPGKSSITSASFFRITADLIKLCQRNQFYSRWQSSFIGSNLGSFAIRPFIVFLLPQFLNRLIDDLARFWSQQLFS